LHQPHYLPNQPGDAFVSHTLRTLAGCAALAAGLWAVTAGARADTPQLPKDAYKKAAEAEIKFLQTRLDELAADAKPKDGKVKPAATAALALAVYADALGDATLRADAMKIAEALAAKNRDIKGAAGAAKKLAVKPGAGPGKGGLPKVGTDDKMLELSMQFFRPRAGGGLGLEKDLDDYTGKTPKAINAAEVELLAVRTAVTLEIAAHYPSEKARKSPSTTKDWEKLSHDSVDITKKILAETAKGKGADEKVLRTQLKNLGARCTDCHGKYRDE
jgi:hypothetical protein